MNFPRFIDSNQRISIHSIFGIGRNYHAHAAEMNSEVLKNPVVFLKPNSALIPASQPIMLPEQSGEVHHEVELVLLVGKEGKNIPETSAETFIAGYTLGIDVTARDLQREAKANGLPWSVAKGFDTFAPIGEFHRYPGWENLSDAKLSLNVNGSLRQETQLELMIFKPAKLVSYLSTIYTLYPGDLIFTGTPAGVAKLEHGDQLTAYLNNWNVDFRVN